MIAEPEPLYVESVGEGPSVVLAHGFTGSARNWRPQGRALRERYHVVTYDLRGHARSPSPHAAPALYARAAFVQDALDVLDAAAGERPVVGGLSLGAGVMLALALAHPERVRALVLASLPAGPGQAGAFSGGASAMADALEREGSEAAGARFVWGPDSGLDARGVALVRQGFLEHDPLALAQVLRGVLSEIAALVDEPGLEERLRMPILLVAGAKDAGSRDATERLAARLPHARVEIIEQAGHVVNLSAPRPFNSALTGFLDSLPARAVPR